MSFVIRLNCWEGGTMFYQNWIASDWWWSRGAGCWAAGRCQDIRLYLIKLYKSFTTLFTLHPQSFMEERQMMTRWFSLCNNLDLERNTFKGKSKYLYLTANQGLDSEQQTIHFSDDVCWRFGPLDPRTTSTSSYRVGIKLASGLAL